MQRIVCGYCYSDKNIMYYHQQFLCEKCKCTMNRCDTCNMYCNNTCLEIFDRILRF